jgi:hypothetical protein
MLMPMMSMMLKLGLSVVTMLIQVNLKLDQQTQPQARFLHSHVTRSFNSPAAAALPAETEPCV